MRVVFDANVMVSAAILPESISRRVIDVIFRTKDSILVSEAIMAEVESVLRRPRFDRYITLENRLLFLAMIARDCEWIEIATHIRECRDPKDDMYLELAVNGKAEVIVTGDKDLHALNPFRGIPILTPAEFLASISNA